MPIALHQCAMRPILRKLSSVQLHATPRAAVNAHGARLCAEHIMEADMASEIRIIILIVAVLALAAWAAQTWAA